MTVLEPGRVVTTGNPAHPQVWEYVRMGCPTAKVCPQHEHPATAYRLDGRTLKRRYEMTECIDADEMRVEDQLVEVTD